MVSSGQLNDPANHELVSRLTDFYENRNVRLAYNGVVYDGWLTDGQECPICRSNVSDKPVVELEVVRVMMSKPWRCRRPTCS
jgi:hypothetical protein